MAPLGVGWVDIENLGDLQLPRRPLPLRHRPLLRLLPAAATMIIPRRPALDDRPRGVHLPARAVHRRGDEEALLHLFLTDGLQATVRPANHPFAVILLALHWRL